jgi:hypothetical protein
VLREGYKSVPRVLQECHKSGTARHHDRYAADAQSIDESIAPGVIATRTEAEARRHHRHLMLQKRYKRGYKSATQGAEMGAEGAETGQAKAE